MSGAVLAAQLRERFAGLRVVFVSGYSAGHLPDEGTGPDTTFLAKPFLPEQLSERVRTMLAAPPEANDI
jgi:FixJ family two-component response regulator